MNSCEQEVDEVATDGLKNFPPSKQKSYKNIHKRPKV